VNPPTDIVQSVYRALQVLEIVGQRATGVSTNAIAAQLPAISRQTVYHYVRTLAYGEYITRLDNKCWVLGPAVAARADDRIAQTKQAPPRPQQPQAPREGETLKAFCVRRYRDGKSLMAVAHEAGKSYTFVRNAVHREGSLMRPQGQAPHEG
jgi:DNA-binding IclR family transcriptional regulator